MQDHDGGRRSGGGAVPPSCFSRIPVGCAGIVPRVERRAPAARVLVVSAVPMPEPDRVDPAEFRDRGDFNLFIRRPPPGH